MLAFFHSYSRKGSTVENEDGAYTACWPPRPTLSHSRPCSSSCLLSLPSQGRVSEEFPYTLEAESVYCLLKVGTRAGAQCCGNSRDSETG